MNLSRRTFLKVLGAGGAASAASSPILRAFADPQTANDEFFLFVHALGGWDVMLWSDPRMAATTIIDPPSTVNCRTDWLDAWTTDTSVTLPDGGNPFKPNAAGKLSFGPGFGAKMLSRASQVLLFNGLSMNTVSHPDGQTYVTTGRHLFGGRAAQSSIDTMLGNEAGVQQLLPVVSLQYPSFFVGSGLDQRAVPLRVSKVDTLAESLHRAPFYESAAERDAVTVVLSEEAHDLAEVAHDPTTMNAIALQLGALRGVLQKNLENSFSAKYLQTAYDSSFSFSKLLIQQVPATNLAFAIEAFKNNFGRCVSVVFNAFDTHFSNYTTQARAQQETFDSLSAFMDLLETTPHPTKPSDTLADHTHILVTSDFCRTPQINLSHGRDHYPNGSALVLSPRFRGGQVFGATDADQLLPTNLSGFSDGPRPVSPPDVLATFLTAFGVQPRKYLRDGEAVTQLLVNP
jgi:hypothetical protein